MSDDIDAVQKAIANLYGPALRKFKGKATAQVALELKGLMTPQPAGVNSPVKWASEKQRRWWFAARREAGLDPKYKRRTDAWSQDSSKAWTIRKEPTSATLGNRATYAPYVQSSEYQTRQHAATGWTTDEQAADQLMSDGTVGRIVNYHLKRAIDEAFRGLT